MIPEPHKTDGICYAVTPGGLELPVIDVTHPAFHLDGVESELFERSERYRKAQSSRSFLARWAQRAILPFFLRRSIIGRGLLKSASGYLDGISTYLLKLGPENLGDGYATKMDRNISRGLVQAGLSINVRLQDMAELMAERLKPVLGANPGRPLHFINIAGGPAMDSLNALILLNKMSFGVLLKREIVIHVLDLEPEGARFGEAALTALQGEDGPLKGLGAQWVWDAYNWNDTKMLEAALQSLPKDAVVAVSSEGGLFDYGSNSAIEANLSCLREFGQTEMFAVVSLSRPDGPGQLMRQGTASALVLRGLEEMSALAEPIGWKIKTSRSRPMFFVVELELH